MTSDQTTNPAAPPAASGKRHSIGVVIGAAVAGLALGALGVFMLAGITWKIRVEFPPPPYPAPFTSAPPASYAPPSPPAASTAPTSAPTGLPVPPLPPGPR
jgi:hypothetical protein